MSGSFSRFDNQERPNIRRRPPVRVALNPPRIPVGALTPEGNLARAMLHRALTVTLQARREARARPMLDGFLINATLEEADWLAGRVPTTLSIELVSWAAGVDQELLAEWGTRIRQWLEHMVGGPL